MLPAAVETSGGAAESLSAVGNMITSSCDEAAACRRNSSEQREPEATETNRPNQQPQTTTTQHVSTATDKFLAALSRVHTSKQWATLPSVVAKVNKLILPRNQSLSVRAAAEMLLSIPSERLRRHGVWVHSFGPNCMPIVCCNPGVGRQWNNGEAASAARTGDTCFHPTCSCGATNPGSSTENFFGSANYNAGKHALQKSAHRPNCMCWTPPTNGHLHSWRRGYES